MPHCTCICVRRGLPPGRGWQGLICQFKKIICAEVLGGSLPPPCRAAGPLPPLHWAAGGLPLGRGAASSPMLYKRFPSPLTPHLLPTTSREREGERRGEGGSCIGEALPDFGMFNSRSFSIYFFCMLNFIISVCSSNDILAI